MTKNTLVVLCLSFAHLLPAQAVPSRKTSGLFNGNLWNNISTEQAKQFYVAGASEALIREAKDTFQKKYMASASTIIDVANSVNRFYSEPQNLDIPIIDAIHIVCMQINHAPVAEIAEEISLQRDSAAGAPERVTAQTPIAQAAPVRTFESNTQPPSPRPSARSEIDAVIKSGKYSQLPPAEVVGRSGNDGPSRMSIVNHTPYTLTVTFDGSAAHSVTVGAGQSTELDLAPGAYRVLGRADIPTVLPFVGNDNYSAGTKYESTFYIRTQIVPSSR